MSTSVLHKILSRAGFSPVTKTKYALVIDRWIEFAGEDPGGWTRDKAQDWYDHLLEDGISVPSANTYLASLRYVSKWYATKTGGIDFAIVQRQRGKKDKSREREGEPILSPEEVTALLSSCSEGTPADRRDLAILVLGLETGMRRMSFLGLAIEAVHHSRGFPSVPVPIKGPGGEETFDVPLSDTAYAALDNWIDWLHSQSTKAGPAFRRLTATIDRRFKRSSKIGEVMSLTGINEMLDKRAKLASIRHINPHMLRHTFISWRSQAGFNPLDIAEITGHKVGSIVVDGVSMNIRSMQTYFHRNVEAIRNSTPAWLRDLVAELIG